MALNAQVEAMLQQFAAMGGRPPLSEMSVEEVRAGNIGVLQTQPLAEVERLDHLYIALEGHSIEARLYVPMGAKGNRPLIVYYHGGGWVVCDLDTHDGLCRHLANASGCNVLSVGYRLAPEHPYPAPFDDCYDAALWAEENAEALGYDGKGLVVAGDSAGGNLAAAVAIKAKENAAPHIRHQLLIYPVTDNDFDTQSYRENGNGDYLLSREAMEWYWGHYMGERRAEDVPYARVLHYDDLSGLPAATILTAQYDPLLDEGAAYAARLKMAGVPVSYFEAEGMIHGFMSLFQFIPDALPWYDILGAEVHLQLGLALKVRAGAEAGAEVGRA